MGEAENPDIGSYASFNDFFTRPLKPSARPIAKADFVSPVDGAISQLSHIDDHQIVQAKGHRFTVADLWEAMSRLLSASATANLPTSTSRPGTTIVSTHPALACCEA